MINEFYAALLNGNAKNSQIGHDYVPETWATKPLSSEASALRGALLVNTQNVTSQNWRALELYNTVNSSDLASLLVQLDHRTGYLKDDIRRSMTQFFTPRVIGGFEITVKGRHKASAYQVDHWQFSSDATDLTITYGDKTAVHTLAAESSMQVPLLGADATVRISTSQNSEASLTWAAVPTITIADTAVDIKQRQMHNAESVARKRNIYDADTIAMLIDVINQSEACTTVAAASLLLVGHTLSL